MSYFAVTREAGPSWTAGKGVFDQPGANDHAAFMDTLAQEVSSSSEGPSPAVNTGASACFSSSKLGARRRSASAWLTMHG
jgi:hypothetical protein